MWSGLVNMLSPSSVSPQNTTPKSTNEKGGKPMPDLTFLQGGWEHSLVPAGVAVDGKKVRIGNRIFDLDIDDTHVEVAGWMVDKFTEDDVRWKEKDGKKRCTWKRKKIGLKRERKPSLVQAQAQRDNDLVNRWMAGPLMRRSAPPTPKPEGSTEEELMEEALPPMVDAPPSPPKPKEYKITDAELRRINKALKRREKKWEKEVTKDKKEDRGCGLSKVKLDEDDLAELNDDPDPLQEEPHHSAEWAGFERLPTHTIPYNVMEHLAKEDFPIGKTKARNRP